MGGKAGIYGVLAVIGFPDEPIIPPVKPAFEETTATE